MIYLALALFIGFLLVLIGTPYSLKYLAASGLVAVDQQKKGKPKIPSSGGIVVLFGFLVSITVYLAFSALFEIKGINTAVTLAALNSAVIIGLIGLLDDIRVDLESVITKHTDIEEDEIDVDEDLKVKQLPHQGIFKRFTGNFFNEESSADMVREGLGQVPKMLFVLPAALPLIAVGAGSWSMTFPFIGTIHWGLFYPLFLLPIGLLFVSNVINMLAGTNGLSAGMSFVASTSLGVFALMNNRMEAALIALSLSASLLAFLKYNFYPASVMPGDVLPYLAGAAMFSSMVIGNIEKFGVFIFAPWFLEFGLKLRSGFTAHSWGILENGRLKPQHDKIYSLTHVFMRYGFTEKQITAVLMAMETLICVTGLILFTAGIL